MSQPKRQRQRPVRITHKDYLVSGYSATQRPSLHTSRMWPRFHMLIIRIRFSTFPGIVDEVERLVIVAQAAQPTVFYVLCQTCTMTTYIQFVTAVLVYIWILQPALMN